MVNNKDLYTALKEGEIFAAGLDVLEKEPITQDNPLDKIKDSEKIFRILKICLLFRKVL